MGKMWLMDACEILQSDLTCKFFPSIKHKNLSHHSEVWMLESSGNFHLIIRCDQFCYVIRPIGL